MRLGLLLLLASPAWAGMKDLTPSRLEAVDPLQRQATFDGVARELLLGVVPTPSWSVGALGLLEGEVAVDNRIGFVHTQAFDGGWAALVEDGKPVSVQYVPRLTVRKGLPWSVEVGLDAGWEATTRQFVVGGYGRWAPLDGWRKVPDVAVQLGYHGYVGNDQLVGGALDFDLSVGYTLPARTSGDRPGSAFSPLIGWSMVVLHAAPRGLDFDLVGGSGFPDRPAGVEAGDWIVQRLFGGIELLTGGMVLRITGDAAFPKGGPPLPALALGLGARF